MPTPRYPKPIPLDLLQTPKPCMYLDYYVGITPKEQEQAVISLFEAGHAMLDIQKYSGLPLVQVARLIGGRTRTSRADEQRARAHREWSRRQEVKSKARLVAVRQRLGLI